MQRRSAAPRGTGEPPLRRRGKRDTTTGSGARRGADRGPWGWAPWGWGSRVPAAAPRAACSGGPDSAVVPCPVGPRAPQGCRRCRPPNATTTRAAVASSIPIGYRSDFPIDRIAALELCLRHECALVSEGPADVTPARAGPELARET